MAETDNKQPQQAPQAQENSKPCPKDCTKCGFQQHAYCAAKMSFDAFAVMSSIIQKINAQSALLASMDLRLKSIEKSEAELVSPSPIQGDLFKEQK